MGHKAEGFPSAFVFVVILPKINLILMSTSQYAIDTVYSLKDSIPVILLKEMPDNAWHLTLTNIITVFFGLSTLMLGIATFILGKKISLNRNVKEDQYQQVKALAKEIYATELYIYDHCPDHSWGFGVKLTYFINDSFKISNKELFGRKLFLCVDIYDIEFMKMGLEFGLPFEIQKAIEQLHYGRITKIIKGSHVVEDNNEDCVLLSHTNNEAEEYRLMTDMQTFDEFHNRVLKVISEVNKWLKKNDATPISFFHLQKQRDD